MPEPEAYEVISSVLVSPNHDISHVQIGQQQYLRLEEFVCLTADGTSYWRLLDSIALDPEQDRNLVYTASCSLATEHDVKIAAAGYHPPEDDWLLLAKRAWRANTETGRFEELPAEDVTCTKDCVEC